MNEWGIPDWQDISAYGETENWNFNQWRWQFLRRRNDLRTEFDAKKQKEYERALAFWQWNNSVAPDGVLTPDQPGFTVSTRLIGGELQSLPNPRISDQPARAIFWTDTSLGWQKFISEEPPDGFLRFDFDLSKPVEPQLKLAQEVLKEFQIDRFGKTVQKRRHPGKWLTYLRVLDAREAGASWSEIAPILTHTAQTIDAARGSHEQACALCFNF